MPSGTAILWRVTRRCVQRARSSETKIIQARTLKLEERVFIDAVWSYFTVLLRTLSSLCLRLSRLHLPPASTADDERGAWSNVLSDHLRVVVRTTLPVHMLLVEEVPRFRVLRGRKDAGGTTSVCRPRIQVTILSMTRTNNKTSLPQLTTNR